MVDWLPFGYAFAAGLVAALNPCSFLMLPSYVAYYLGADEKNVPTVLMRGRQGLFLGLAMTAGFLLLFSLLGAVISLFAAEVLRFFPNVGLVAGVALIVLGLWLLFSRRTLGFAAATRVRVRLSRSVRGAFLFGIGFGLASFGCTLPVFMVVVGSALSTRSLERAILQFVAYGLGMSLLVIAVVVSAVLLKGYLSERLERLLPYIHRVAALFLIGAGVYLVYRWWQFGAVF